MKRVLYATNRKIDRVRKSISALNEEHPRNPAIAFVTADPKLTVTFKDGSKMLLNMDKLSDRWLEEVSRKMKLQ